MKKFSLKFGVGILAFVLGILSVVIWFVYPLSRVQTLDVPKLVNVETETAEEYAVYSAVLNELIIKNRENLESLTISDETSFYGNSDYLEKTPFEERIKDMKKYYPSVSEEILTDYESKQMRPFKIRPDFNLPVEYVLVDAKEIKKSEGYAAAGMIILSKVGFNQKRNQAFVEIEYFCPLCGFGNHLLLEKENGIWKIKETFDGWAS